MPPFPSSLGEIQSMGGSWNRMQCECQGEDSGGQSVHMPLPGLVSLIFSVIPSLLNLSQVIHEVVSAVAKCSLLLHVFPVLTFLSNHYVSFLFNL